jgi:hypothetical protein
MTRIIVDEVLREKLQNFAQPLDLYDEEGRILARVTPLPDLSEFEPWEPSFDEEELQRQEQSGKWYTTAEVLDYLKRLENS